MRPSAVHEVKEGLSLCWNRMSASQGINLDKIND